MFARLLLSLLLCSATFALYGQWQWVDNSENTLNTEQVSDIAIDDVRDVIYTAGYITGEPSFSGIPNGSFSGGEDGFVMKYDLNGNVIWGFAVGGSANDRVTGIAVDESTGNIFVTGYLEGNSGSNGTNLGGTGSGASGAVSTIYGNQDIFVAMYNSFGQLVWQRVLGGTSMDQGMDIALNSTGVFVTGIYTNTTGISTLPSPIAANGLINNFVIAFNKGNGNTLWDAVMGSNDNDYDVPNSPWEVERVGITADDNGVYAVNYFFGSVYEIYHSSNLIAASVLEVNGSQEDFVVTAYSNTGNYNWSALYTNSGIEVNGLGITNDCSGVYVTGTLHHGGTSPGGTVINSNHDDAIISKLDKTSGSEIWLKEFDSNFDHDDHFVGLEADGYGNLLAVGRLRGTTLSSGTDFNYTTGASYSEVMLAQYSTDGVFQSFEVFPSSQFSWALAIASYKNEEYVLGGYCNGNLTFGTVSVSNTNLNNGFIANYQRPDPLVYTSASGSNTYCESEVTANAVLNAPPGGVFSGPSEIVFNSTAMGEIDLAGSTPGGPYTIVYSGFPTCAPYTVSYDIFIVGSSDASFTFSANNYCTNDVNPVPASIATSGGIFTTNGGLSIANTSTGEIDIAGSTPGGPYMLYYTLNGGTCPETDSLELSVVTSPDPTFVYEQLEYCQGGFNPLPSAVATMGGTFSASSGVVINPITGEVDLASSTAGGPYSIKYVVSNAYCSDSVDFDLTINAMDDASFSYATSNFCQNESNPLPTSVATSGGIFSGPTGLVVNPTTGEIDIASSTVGGPYWLVYTTPGPNCPNSDSIQVSIQVAPNPAFAYSQSAYCTGGFNPIPGTLTAGTFSAPAGLIINPTTGIIDLTNSQVGGPYAVKYVVSNAYCSDSTTFDITINPLDDASFDYASSVFCINESDPVPTSIATSGGTFFGSTGAIVNTGNGEIDIANSTMGTVLEVTYLTNGACPSVDTFTFLIEEAPNPSFTYAQTAYCNNEINPLPNSITTTGGTFTASNGLVINSSTGEIDLTASFAGETYTIQYIVSNANCEDTATFDVTINQSDDASFTYVTDHFCNNEVNPLPTSIGTAGGVFSGPTALNLNPTSGEINVDSSAVGGPYWLKYTTSNPTCPDADSIQVYIENAPDATFDYSQSSYCQGTGMTLSPTLIVTYGGTFSAPTGVVIDAGTGTIDLDASMAGGPYSIEYTVTNTYCQKTHTFEMTIVEQDALSSVAYSTSDFCVSDGNQIPQITGVSGGTFVGPTSIDIVNATTGEISPSTSTPGGPYTIQYLTSGSCPDSVEIVLSISDMATAYAGQDQELFFIFSSMLDAAPPINGTGEWSTTSNADISDIFDQNSDVSNLELGENIFIWTVSNGVCPAVSDEVVINVEDIFIPQAVTPNGDGKNDFLEIKLSDGVICILNIFNRWGQLVYENSDYQSEWNGQNSKGEELENDTYFYTILINDSISYNGYVVLKK